MMKNIRTMAASGMGNGDLLGEGAERIFWVGDSVLCLDWV